MKRTTIIAALLLALPAAAEPIEPADVRVIDGDTIQVYGVDPNVRLVGFDTPEIRAACAEERDLGRRATERLRALVRAGGLDFHYVRCSCSDGRWCVFRRGPPLRAPARLRRNELPKRTRREREQVDQMHRRRHISPPTCN
jgi:hypothetical protein